LVAQPNINALSNFNSNMSKTPKSPDIAALEKFTDIPIDYATGVPSINIPICNLSQGDLNVPVSLSYHNGGVVVGEAASWVGQNWALNAGGMISIIKNGLKDDSGNGYLNRYSNVHNTTTGDTVFLHNTTYYGQFEGGTLDTEPDFYNYNFGGYSGKFLIDPNKNVFMLPKSELKVVVNWNGSIMKGVTMIAPDGTRYHFGKTPYPAEPEEIYEYSFITGGPEITALYLVKIETADKLHWIKFKYISNDYTFRSPCSELAYADQCGAIVYPNNYVDCYREVLINSKVIDSIYNSSNTSSIAFTRSSTARTDVSGTAKFLKSIVFSNGIQCQKFELYQSYFKDPNYNFLGGSRLKLDSLKEGTCAFTFTKPAYKFVYDGPSSGGFQILPKTHSRSIDHWGFYNGKNNDNVTLNAMTFSSIQYFSGGDRNTDSTYMKYGHLKKVIYPTGGFMEMEMEANNSTYMDYMYSDIFTMQNCFPTSVSSCCAAPVKITNFTFTSHEQIQTAVFRLKTNYIQPICDTCYNTSNPPGATIQLYRGATLVGSTTYNLPNAICGTLEDHEFPLVSNVNNGALDQNEQIVPGVLYTFKLISGKGISEFFLKTKVLTATNKQMGGLRARKITLNDGSGSNVKDIVKTYDYNSPINPGKSSAILKWIPQYVFYTANWPTSHLNAPYFGPNSEFVISQPKLPNYSLRSGNLIYEYVTEKIAGNGRKQMKFFVGSRIYNLDLELPGKLDEFEGKMSNMKIYSENNTLLQEVTYTVPPQIINEKFNFLISKRLLVPTTICGTGLSFPSWPVFYDVYTREPFLIQSTTTYQDGVSCTETNTYDTQGRVFRPLTTETTNSDGKIHKSEFTFPYAITGNVAIDSLKAKNIITPIITYKKVDNVIVDGNKVSYKLHNTFPYQDSFYRYKVTWNGITLVNTGWDLEAKVNGYDLLVGKPNSVTVRNWSPLTYEYYSGTGLLKKEIYQSNTKLYEYHTGYGLIKRITDIDGQFMDFNYDGLGRLTYKMARPTIPSPNLIPSNYNVYNEYTYHYKDATDNYNWVKNKTKISLTTNSALDSVVMKEVYDGLGRSIQSINIRHSPAGKDVVVGREYDNRGRLFKQYQPVESNSPTGTVISIPGTTKFTLSTFEESPLNRVLTITPPSWYATTYTYSNNTGSTEVPNQMATGNFAVNSLFKVTTTNPDGNKTIVYKDKLGREILTWQTDAALNTGAKTYSLYDNKNRIVAVYPPGAVAANSEIIFNYTYDGSDNIITKKTPGKGLERFVYNTKYQPTFYKDATYATNDWLHTKYDIYGRIDSVGRMNIANPAGDTKYPLLDTFSIASYFTVPVTDGVKYGKLKQSKTRILGTNLWLQSDYNYDAFGRVNSVTGNNHLNPSTTAETITTTYDFADHIMTINRVHKPSSSQTHNVNQRFTYDAAGRQGNLFININGGGEKKISNQTYTFKDQLAEKNLGAFNTTYLQSIDYSYNEQGWLTSINGPTLGSPYLAFPTGCSPALPNTPSTPVGTDPDVHDLFYMEMKYDTVFSSTSGGITGMPANLQKSGNISQIAWRIKGRDRQAYNFTYDYLNRMLNSTHYKVSAANAATTSNNYNENLTYDSRGNIMTLQRQGYYTPACSYNTIDNLIYNYTTDLSRLASITENASATYKSRGFNPGSGGVGYSYDNNGNLKSDTYKGITNIVYNHLNLPTQILWGTTKSLEFLYDASGNKLRKTVKTGSTVNSIKEYIGGIEYDSIPGAPRKINSIYHAEGRFFNTDTWDAPIFRTEYTIKDHLGNGRIYFADLEDDGKIDVNNNTSVYLNDILQENQYYPFGMAHEGPWLFNASAPDNMYQYNSKELNVDHGLNFLDYGARWYDPSIGRFTTTDRFTEKYLQMTPYQYGANNPIKFIDVNGDSIMVNNITWTPGTSYTGNDKFVNSVFNALNSLFSNIDKDGAGNVKTKEAEGNVIIDFAYDKKRNVSINETKEGSFTSEDGTNIFWNPNQEIYVTPKGKDKEGIISSETLLAHEFGHSWLAQYSPQMNNLMETYLKTDAEHIWVLSEVENKFSSARKEGVRLIFNSVVKSKEDLKSATHELHRNNNHTTKVDYLIYKKQ